MNTEGGISLKAPYHRKTEADDLEEFVILSSASLRAGRAWKGDSEVTLEEKIKILEDTGYSQEAKDEVIARLKE